MKIVIHTLNLLRNFTCGVVLFFTLSGCASIGSPTVQLSGEVGVRIADMQSTHVASIEAYFDAEIMRIEKFLKDTWEPLFLRNFLGQTAILSDLQNVSKFSSLQRNSLTTAVADYLDDPVEAPDAVDKLIKAVDSSRKTEPEIVKNVLNDFVEDSDLAAATIHVSALLASDEPARMIMDFAQDAHTEMNAQRKELLNPINAQKQQTVSEVQAAYARLTAAQGMITGRLAAASKFKDEQDAVFAKLAGEGSADAIRQKLVRVNQEVSLFLSNANEVLDADPESKLTVMLENILSK